MKSITIKAGRTHKWVVDVIGEPPPKLTWSWKESISLVNTERIHIENIDYQTTFQIATATRKDTGKYTLLAENDSGKDEASLELTVLGLLTSHFLQTITMNPIFRQLSICSIKSVLYILR